MKETNFFWYYMILSFFFLIIYLIFNFLEILFLIVLTTLMGYIHMQFSLLKESLAIDRTIIKMNERMKILESIQNEIKKKKK